MINREFLDSLIDALDEAILEARNKEQTTDSFDYEGSITSLEELLSEDNAPSSSDAAEVIDAVIANVLTDCANENALPSKEAAETIVLLAQAARSLNGS